MFFREAFQIFTKTKPHCLKLNLKSFVVGDHKDVLRIKQTPLNQCKCQIHENMILKFQALGINYEDFYEKALILLVK